MSITVTKMLSKAVAVSALVSLVILTAPGCGGGGGNVKVKNNEIFGALPSIVVNYNNADDALREKKKTEQEAAQKKQNMKKYTAADESYKKASTALDEKYEADRKAEWAKVNGKAVPFTMSEKFKALNLDVTSVKVDGEKKTMVANIVASDELKVNSRNCNNYTYAYYNALKKDGTAIEGGKSSFLIMICLDARNGLTFTKGQSLRSDGKEATGGAWNMNEGWADFASIEFVTMDEWK